MEQTPAEQYLLFDPTEYIKGIEHIGQIALSELIYGDPYDEEPYRLSELLQSSDVHTDNTPRLFEV
jgi:hypothetical protein